MRNEARVLPTHLESQRLVLRPYARGDAPVLLAMVEAERERLWSIFAPPVRELRSEDDASALIDRLARDWSASRQFIISLWTRGDERLIGECYLGGFLPDWSEAEVGVFLLAGAEQRGLATEALSLAMREGRRALGVRRFHYRCDADNARSVALALRLGFAESNERRGERLDDDGTPVRVRHFCLLQPQEPSNGG